MRLLHTADWHLGHTLHEIGREREHGLFLDWLLDTLGAAEVDALLIAGDVFETANPTAEAQAAWYRFLARARARFPHLHIVVIGGNHDSAARLDAPNPILRELTVHVIGGLPRRPSTDAEGRPGTGAGALDLDRLLVPLARRDGSVGAWVAAVPFLRPVDLPPVPAGEGDGGGDRLVEGVRRIYREVLDAARGRRQPGQALVAMGHCYLVGTTVSELSERKILGGHQHALPVDLFPDDVAYVALGHLHLAQAVGGRAGVRYSGSPIPLALSENEYPHQICLVDLDGERLAGVRPLAVPRTRTILRIPYEGPRPLDEVLALLATLPPAGPETPAELRPLLEVRVLLDRPEPALRRRIEPALEGKGVRLVKITPELAGRSRALAELAPHVRLSELRPEDVFIERYRRDFGVVPPDELLATFHELVEQVERGEVAPR
ncbi:MAG TPA: exonuclease SbcCD subunit D C-terminal domain-containing protein [Polyangia bacterium]|jgi:exonuclease SbcD|nr:exonuclease SbcCD subunit D C-terminal domain-containing protein [Polyangia bacterium]